MAISKPDLTRVWASGAPGGNVIDPDVTTPGKFLSGWLAEVPPFEHFNFLQKLFTEGAAYNNEQGVNGWDTDTVYPIGAIVKGSDNILYITPNEQSGNNPISDIVNWLALLGGSPVAADLTRSKLEIVTGVIRQEVPEAITLTAVGTTATAVKNAHGYSNGDNIRHDGANETDYNGFFPISNVTTNTYDYTMLGSPASPATGAPVAHKNSKWDLIGGAHTNTGIASIDVVGSSITVNFTKTYTNAIYAEVGGDETLSNRDQLVLGTSLGLSSAVIKGSMSIVGSSFIRWDGAAWVIIENTFASIGVRVASFGSGDLRLEHDFCPGLDILVSAWTPDRIIAPYYPIVANIPAPSTNTGITLNFMDPPAGTLRNDSAPNTSMAFQFTKRYNEGIIFDGTDVSGLGDSSTIAFHAGNVWFYFLMEL